MEEMPSLWLVHFTVRSAEGIAALWIEHPVSRQTLMLPVYPSDAVTEALPLLEPAFAHYAAQWPRIMVANPEEPEDKDFFVEASELPARITDPANRERLQEILERHLPDGRWIDLRHRALRIMDDEGVARMLMTVSEDSVSAQELGIEPFGG